MKNKPVIRPAAAEDASTICRIYNHYIENTVITFEEEPITPEEIALRMASIREKGFPWIVAEVSGEITGYAYASPWRVRKAYRFSSESTIYVSPDARRQGLGEALYRKLIEILKSNGYHRLYGVVALPNESSQRLHEKLGFRKVAHLSETGYKFSRWIDVGYWELSL